MEPGKVFKKKDTITWTEIWAERFQLLHDLKRPKMCLLQKTQLWHCYRRAAQSQTAMVKAHSGDAMQHPHPMDWSMAVIADEEQPSIAQQAIANNMMSPALQQDNDIS